jgi:hypothetical protein
MIYFPRNACPWNSRLPTIYINMTHDEALTRLNNARAWMERNSGLKGTHEYTYKKFEEVFAMRRLAEIACEILQALS